ncbi:Rv1157c family protein [Corynebacterium sp. A21]|uniref:Rv1157c family protein n=1 Tax=Corynebacterium sp. A21 TaxID=3457318 RepID=UPI003FD4FE1C
MRRISTILGTTLLLAGAGMGTAAANPLSSSLPLDQLGRPNAQVLQQARDFVNQPWMPAELRGPILTAVAFFEGGGEGGPELPENAPNFTQFAWPTVAGDCIGGQADAVGSAIAVPGPVEIPFPGAGVGQTAFVFTALGTSPATPEQGGMFVHWININTLKTGTTALGNHGINPDGPATLSGTADTGHGTILAMATGDVHTEDAICSFVPTGALVEVR